MPQTWTAFSTLTGLSQAHGLGEALESLNPIGVGVVEIDERTQFFEVSGYFTAPPDETKLDLLAAVFDAKPFVLSKVADQDWVAQVRRELTPVRAGRFFVYGGHDADKVPPSAFGIRIEAAMAFGTGHHETTLGCLTAIDALGRTGFKPKKALDLGCGTGVLGMAATTQFRCPVLATDIDAIASLTARENAKINHLTPWLRSVTAMGFNTPQSRQNAPYDLIMANILAGPLKRLAPEIAQATQKGGKIILSGILTSQAIGVEKVFAGWRCHVADRIRLQDWTTLVLTRI